MILEFQLFSAQCIDKNVYFLQLVQKDCIKPWSLLPTEEEILLIAYLIVIDSLNNHIIAKWSLSHIC